MKKTTALVLCIVLLVSVLAGCSDNRTANNQETSKTTKVTQTVETTKESTTVQEKQKREFWILFNESVADWPQDLESDIMRKYIQEKSGFKYRVECYNSADYKTKLQLYISSGNMPDMWTAITFQDLKQYKEQKIIIPITKLFEEYGKDIKGFVYEGAIKQLTFDGELWSLPMGVTVKSPAGIPATGWAPMIRKDWLDKLNLEVPETLDQLHDVYTAFVNEDPDGNSKKDTFGYTTSPDQRFGYFTDIFNAFGITPKHWVERDGKLVMGEMTEEYKDAVKLLRQWYSEGLIDPEFPMMTYQNREEKIINSKAGAAVGHPWEIEPGMKLEDSLRKLTPEGDLIHIDPYIGPTGKRGNQAGTFNSRLKVISTACEQPELLMQLWNWFAKDENYLLRVGIPGTHWDWNADKTQVIFKDEWKSNKDRAKFGAGNPTSIYHIQDQRTSSPEIRKWLEFIEKYMLDNKFDDTVPAMLEYSDLGKIIDETTIKVILGSAPVEELDKMQERWYKDGGQKITDQVNAEYSKRSN